MTQYNANKQKKILIVEDHPLFRGMLVQLINKEVDMTVCGEADNARDAITLVKETLPDLVIIDLTLKETSGLELIKHLTATSAELPLLVISMYDENVYAERTLRAGARGYISKLEDPPEVIKAITNVLAGHIYISEHASEGILESICQDGGLRKISELNNLSDRELEVLQYIGLGLTSRKIALQLNVGISTVDSYRSRIKCKLGISNAAELYQKAGKLITEHHH